MPSIQVRTTQNVMIEYPVASVLDRIWAYLIDALLVGAFAVFVFFTLVNIGMEPPVSLIVLLVAPILFYHLLCEVFMNGQSLGKKALNIKVIKLDGSRPGFGAYFLRWILRPIDTGFYGAVAIILIITNKNGQRLGDMAAGTTVIKLMTLQAPASHPQGIDEEYKPVYPEVFRLSDEEVDLIDKALDYMRKQNNPGPAELLAEKLATKMGVKLEGSVQEFLLTVKKDYFHVTSA